MRFDWDFNEEKNPPAQPLSVEAAPLAPQGAGENATLQGISEELILESRPDLSKELERIPDKLFFRIGEVADILELKPYVLRFWETEFPMVAPRKSATGQRVYRRREVELLFLIKHLLHVERFSIEGARKQIKDLKREGDLRLKAALRGENPAKSLMSNQARAELRDLIADLKGFASKPLTDFFRF